VSQVGLGLKLTLFTVGLLLEEEEASLDHLLLRWDLKMGYIVSQVGLGLKLTLFTMGLLLEEEEASLDHLLLRWDRLCLKSDWDLNSLSLLWDC